MHTFTFLTYLENTHSTLGPVHIEKIGYDVGVQYWLSGIKEMGYQVKDLNSYYSQHGSS